jgi:catechol 2,3-dioxygenase-like lactoylglutathione lyase family enzyme
VPGADITGLAGILIWTGNYEAMRAFYVDTLGLTPRSDRPGFVNFDWGGVRLTVSIHADVHGPAQEPLRLMVNFTVPDIEATHRRLVDAGVAFSRPPEQEKWGGWVATFHDPDGNTLQLFQLPQ